MRRFLKAVLAGLTCLAAAAISLAGCADPESTAGLLHEDAAQAYDALALPNLFASYSFIFDEIAAGRMEQLEALLEEMKAAHIPQELTALFERYNALSGELARSLAAIEVLLNTASDQIDAGSLKDAGASLDAAEVMLGGVSLVPAEIGVLTENIGLVLGSALGSDPDLRATYNGLLASEARLEDALVRLEELRQRLMLREQGAALSLLPTELSLNLAGSSFYPGDPVVISGRLTSLGNTMPGRTIILAADGFNAAAVTDAQGNYRMTAAIPARYSAGLLYRARYTPQGSDLGTYQSAASDSARLNIAYYETAIGITAPAEINPGLPFKLTGTVGSDGPSIARTLTVGLGGIVLATGEFANAFEFNITPPASLPPGTYQLVVTAPASGRHSGASVTRGIELTKLPLALSSRTSSFVVWPGTLHVSGTFAAGDGATPPGRVMVSLDGGESYTQNASGSFNFEIRLPAGFYLFQSRMVNISLSPAEPWYGGVNQQTRLFVLNPLTSGGLLLALALGFAVLRRKRPAGASVTAGFLTELVWIEPPSAAPPPPFGAFGKAIISYYLKARRAVAAVTGTRLLPQTTLREFFSGCRSLVSPVRRAFGELTGLTEWVLYSRTGPGEDGARQAGEHARTVAGGCEHESD